MCEPGTSEIEGAPSWWSARLYSFISAGLPPAAWAWEFMRRARLQELFRGARPVDAMNPSPALERIDSSLDWNLYLPWNHERWETRKPVFLPPAVVVTGRGGWPLNFHGQQYRIHENEERRNLMEIKIDLNRRNSAIFRDLKRVLELLREDFPEPTDVRPRYRDWAAQRILQVWDLRQFSVSWQNIGRGLDFCGENEDKSVYIQNARNAYNTAKAYIDDGKWLDFALYIESDDC
ncbi:MAG: hypothetical protein AB1921_09190 [Thermodesulfobacteriota bacterium]